MVYCVYEMLEMIIMLIDIFGMYALTLCCAPVTHDTRDTVNTVSVTDTPSYALSLSVPQATRTHAALNLRCFISLFCNDLRRLPCAPPRVGGGCGGCGVRGVRGVLCVPTCRAPLWRLSNEPRFES